MALEKDIGRNFRGENLIGKSFKAQNLSGVDFSYADIRGADFTNANLTNANFSYVKAGITPRWQNVLGLALFFFVFISGIVAALPGISITISLNPEIYIFSIICDILLLIIFVGLTVFRRLNKAIFGTFTVLGLYGSAILIVYLGNSLNIIDIPLQLPANILVQGLFFSISMIVAILAIAAMVVWSSSERINSQLAFLFSVTLAVCLVGIRTKDTIFLWILSETTTIVISITGLYIAKQAILENSKYAFVKNAIIGVKTFKSTCFKNANLTNANFTQANLKDTDLRATYLTRTNWLHTENLNQAHLSSTYLSNLKIRQLLIDRKGNQENFNHLNLTKLNLQNANLAKASFIETNLSDTNLRGVDLSQAILVRTRLEDADLTGAILTGTRIDTWRIFKNTNLDRTICKYIYLRQSDLDNDNLERFPYQREFEKYEFSDFVYKLLNTLDLYHDRNFNPQVAINVLHSLSEGHQNNLEIVGLEKQGNDIVLKLSVPESIKHQEFKQEYQSRYQTTLNLLLSNSERLLPSSNVIEAQVSTLTESFEKLNWGKSYIFDRVENEGTLIIG